MAEPAQHARAARAQSAGVRALPGGPDRHRVHGGPLGRRAGAALRLSAARTAGGRQAAAGAAGEYGGREGPSAHGGNAAMVSGDGRMRRSITTSYPINAAWHPIIADSHPSIAA